VVSPRAATILDDLLQRQASEKALLLEACQLLRERGQVLAPELLPTALGITDRQLQAALQPALGERGRWLSQFDDSWHWAATALAEDQLTDEKELEQLWNEGSLSVRQSVLASARRRCPDRAREWLNEAWPREKVEARLQLLESISASLTEQDIPFLEDLAKDRSVPVRARASELLCTLGSANVAGKLREWASAILNQAVPKKSLGARLRQLAGAAASPSIAVAPPNDYDSAWRELGIAEKPPAGLGKRSYWMREILRRVDPSHWSQRFQATPAELIAAVEIDEFGRDVIEAWTAAADLFHATDWTSALWSFWLDRGAQAKNNDSKVQRDQTLPRLLTMMLPEDVERLLSRALFGGHHADLPVTALIDALAAPWSADFGSAYLTNIRRALTGNDSNQRMVWASSLATASIALPPECFRESLREWRLPEAEDYYARYAQKELDQFLETVQTRARLRELICSE
jgi:hypothetical protein